MNSYVKSEINFEISFKEAYKGDQVEVVKCLREEFKVTKKDKPYCECLNTVIERGYMDILHLLYNEILRQNKVLMLNRAYKPTSQEKKEKFDIIDEDLMVRTWRPDRFMQWCMPIDEIIL